MPMCRLCTGDGFSKRGLYTNDEDVVYVLKGLGGVNGINLVVNRPDLLERFLIIPLESLPDTERISEKHLMRNFDELNSSFLGAMFDGLSKAMKHRPGVDLAEKPRLADFAEWGCAAGRGFEINDSDFLKVYKVNVGEQNSCALEASPVAEAYSRSWTRRPHGKGRRQSCWTC